MRHQWLNTLDWPVKLPVLPPMKRRAGDNIIFSTTRYGHKFGTYASYNHVDQPILTAWYKLAYGTLEIPIHFHVAPYATCFHAITLQWRYNEPDGVSNQPLFRRRSKKTSKLRVTGLCEGNSPVTGEFPAERASIAENVSIWWRHHDSDPSPLRYVPFITIGIVIIVLFSGTVPFQTPSWGGEWTSK